MTVRTKASLMQRFLNLVERGGNALPHPATLFLLLALITLAFSLLGHVLGWEIVHPATGEIVKTKNLYPPMVCISFLKKR